MSLISSTNRNLNINDTNQNKITGDQIVDTALMLSKEQFEKLDCLHKWATTLGPLSKRVEQDLIDYLIQNKIDCIKVNATGKTPEDLAFDGIIQRSEKNQSMLKVLRAVSKQSQTAKVNNVRVSILQQETSEQKTVRLFTTLRPVTVNTLELKTVAEIYKWVNESKNRAGSIEEEIKQSKSFTFQEREDLLTSLGFQIQPQVSPIAPSVPKQQQVVLPVKPNVNEPLQLSLEIPYQKIPPSPQGLKPIHGTYQPLSDWLHSENGFPNAPDLQDDLSKLDRTHGPFDIHEVRGGGDCFFLSYVGLLIEAARNDSYLLPGICKKLQQQDGASAELIQILQDLAPQLSNKTDHWIHQEIFSNDQLIYFLAKEIRAASYRYAETHLDSPVPTPNNDPDVLTIRQILATDNGKNLDDQDVEIYLKEFGTLGKETSASLYNITAFLFAPFYNLVMGRRKPAKLDPSRIDAGLFRDLNKDEKVSIPILFTQPGHFRWLRPSRIQNHQQDNAGAIQVAVLANHLSQPLNRDDQRLTDLFNHLVTKCREKNLPIPGLVGYPTLRADTIRDWLTGGGDALTFIYDHAHFFQEEDDITFFFNQATT